MSKEIVNGSEVFKLVDTHGIPLDVIVLELRDKNRAFNIAQFIEAASLQGWPEKRTVSTIVATSNDKSKRFKGMLAILCSKYYPTLTRPRRSR